MKEMKLDKCGKTSFIMRLENKLIRDFLQPQADEKFVTVQEVIRQMIVKAYNQKEKKDENQS